jgi:hypothetical protein
MEGRESADARDFGGHGDEDEGGPGCTVVVRLERSACTLRSPGAAEEVIVWNERVRDCCWSFLGMWISSWGAGG